MTQQRPQSVLITGASSGIGEATALRLDARGFRVFAGVRNEDAAQALRERASERLTPLMLDVTDGSTIARAVETVGHAEAGTILGIVNNAGIVMPGPLEFLPLEDVRMQLEVNVVGVLAVTQAFLPLLRASGNGRIVNISSINGRMALRFIGSYVASKFALEGMSDTLRMELRRWNIRVVVIEPGAVATPIFDVSRRRGKTIAERMPRRAEELYPRVLSAMRDRRGRTPRRAIAPDRVARVIERALTARRPKTRYLVGRDAKLGALAAALLPDRLLDRLLTR